MHTKRMRMTGGRDRRTRCFLTVHEDRNPSARKVITDKGPIISPRQIRAAEGPGKIVAMRVGRLIQDTPCQSTKEATAPTTKSTRATATIATASQGGPGARFARSFERAHMRRSGAQKPRLLRSAERLVCVAGG